MERIPLLILSLLFVFSLAQPDGTPRLSGAGYVTTDCNNLALGQEPPFPNNYLDEVNNYLYPALRKLQSQRDLPGYYRRTFHFPTTGCVYANFTVNADIPASYQVGIFKTPGTTYQAFMRFSGFDKETQNVSDTRGLAIKLSNVPGTKLLPGFEGDTHHDFLFNAFPVFTFGNETAFSAGVMARVELGGGGDRLRSQFGVFYPANAAIDKLQTANNTVISQLTMPYYGISPFKFGLAPLPSPAVKYRLYPCNGVDPAINATLPDPEYLTKDMQTRLRADPFCYYFQIQFQKNPCLHPINDFTVEWLETDTPYITVATIIIPPQTVLTDNDMYCKHAAMNVWRVLPEHRPLGSLNRARLFAMINSHNQRLALDNVVEPFTGRNHPGLQFWLPEELGINTNFVPASLKVNFPGNPYAYVNQSNVGPGAKTLANGGVPTPSQTVDQSTTQGQVSVAR